jgi:hypothetical protein
MDLDKRKNEKDSFQLVIYCKDLKNTFFKDKR